LREASKLDGTTFRLLDLASYDLPFFNEALAPLSNPGKRIVPEHVQRWLDDMAEADGYVFLTPEYNYAIPAVLKNALDFLAHEAAKKPASILSYSDTMHGGNIAGHELRLTLNKLEMLPLPKSLPLAYADQLLSEDGVIIEHSTWAEKVAHYVPFSLQELLWYADALKSARQKQMEQRG
jgi:NAD(P)H-dependent FMN reductase